MKKQQRRIRIQQKKTLSSSNPVQYARIQVNFTVMESVLRGNALLLSSLITSLEDLFAELSYRINGNFS
jgi:hypothetical protein